MRAATILATVVAISVAGSACTSNRTATGTPPSPSRTPSRRPTSPFVSPSVTPSTSPSASCADRVLAGLTEAQRVGQLIVTGLAGDRLGPAELAAIRDQHIGSVSFIETTTEGVAAVRTVTDAVQAEATDANTGGVRFFISANQEGGQIQGLRGPGFDSIPSAVTQGGLDTATLQADAQRWGGELRAAGVNLDFAPVMDVVPPGTDAQNQPIGVLHREYGHDPATAGSHGSAFLRGMTAAGVATTAKHFPGLGRVKGNTDFTSGVVDDVTTSNDPYLGSFAQAIVAGVPFVMVALATYTRIDPNHLAAFSPAAMSLLRGPLGFSGVIISDDLGATVAVSNIPPATRATDFLDAGGDLIISKTADTAVPMAEGILARTATDPAFAARVADAARHVLAAKEAFGLLPC